MEQDSKPVNLAIESYQIQGARQMLLRLLDVYDILPKGKKRKDDEVYIRAEMDLILSSKDNTRHFLCGDKFIRYRGHERDKKGKLIKVEAYFSE